MKNVRRDNQQVAPPQMEALIGDNVIHIAAHKKQQFVEFVVMRLDLVIGRVNGVLDLEVLFHHVVLVQPGQPLVIRLFHKDLQNANCIKTSCVF